MMSMKLKDLISRVRAAKTAAEERGTIFKESAMLRTAFKEEDNTFRHRNVAKLLYIHMLGYPSHFGQMECLKLIASPRFIDKRIGYLGLALLVEGDDVLTLVTNSLSSDLGSRSPYIQGLALAALGNISNKDMLRDLSTQVLRTLSSTTIYVKKKASLCSIQIFSKVPDMIEDFLPVMIGMLGDRNNSVQLTAVTAILYIAQNNPKFIKKIRKTVPQLVKILKTLVLSSYSPDHDINRSIDPFLQVNILALLGVLGHDHPSATEQMNDILAQVATNTESSRGSGNAILYECVRTIFSIDSEDGLRVLAVNALGKFLQSRDNNIRYVALNMLGTVIHMDMDAVLRHKETIVECLRDADSSIRVRAIDLVFAMMNHSSVKELTGELLNYLVLANSEQKFELTKRLHNSSIQYTPNKSWHVHTLISIMCIAGNECADNIWQTCIALIGQPESEEFRPQVIHRLYHALKEDGSQSSLVNTAIWSLGEFGLSLLSPAEKFDPNTEGEYYEPINENEVIELLEKVRRSHLTTNVAKGMILSSYTKLSAHFTEQNEEILNLLAVYQNSMNVDLQARSCEFLELTSNDYSQELKLNWLAQMPVPTDEEMAERRATAALVKSSDSDSDSDEDDSGSDSDEEDSDEDDSDEDDSDSNEKPKKRKSKQKPSKSQETNLLDMDDIFSGSSNAAPPTSKSSNTDNGSGNQMDLLGEIFGGGGGDTAPPTAPVMNNNNDDLLGMFGGGASPSDLNNAADATNESFPVLNAFDKNGVKVTMNFSRGVEKEVVINCTYSNSNADTISEFKFQAALPKFCNLKRMHPPSGNELFGFSGNEVTQRIDVINNQQGQKAIVMKVKISYIQSGSNFVEQATVSGFPDNL